jgi:hypothetical protein
LVSLMLLALLVPSARGEGEREMASLMLKWARSTAWPSGKSRSPGAPFVIGIIGDDSVSGTLGEQTQALRIEGRSVLVKSFMAIEEIVGCNVLFVSRSELPRQRKILHEAQDKNVLTFGETDSFDRDGGMITFVHEEGKLKMIVNKRNLSRGSLKVSTELLGLSTVIVHDR